MGSLALSGEQRSLPLVPTMILIMILKDMLGREGCWQCWVAGQRWEGKGEQRARDGLEYWVGLWGSTRNPNYFLLSFLSSEGTSSPAREGRKEGRKEGVQRLG